MPFTAYLNPKYELNSFFQVKIVEKYFSGNITSDNARLINQSLQHSLKFIRVSFKCFLTMFTFMFMAANCYLVLMRIMWLVISDGTV